MGHTLGPLIQVFAEDNFRSQMGIEETKLGEKLLEVQGFDPHIDAVMLLATKVEKTGRASWGNPETSCRLLPSPSSQWVDVAASTAKVGRGRAAAPKLDLVALWATVEWHKHPRGNGPKVALLGHFLKSMKLPSENVGKRARNLNKRLAAAGSSCRLVQLKMSKSGSTPWVGNNSTLRQIYKLL